jgi:hypothetical protein
MHLIGIAAIGFLLLAIIGPRGMGLLLLLGVIGMGMMFAHGIAWN